MRTREIDVVIFNEDIEALDNIDNAIVSVFKSAKGGVKAKLVFEEDRKVTITESDLIKIAENHFDYVMGKMDCRFESFVKELFGDN